MYVCKLKKKKIQPFYTTISFTFSLYFFSLSWQLSDDLIIVFSCMLGPLAKRSLTSSTLNFFSKPPRDMRGERGGGTGGCLGEACLPPASHKGEEGEEGRKESHHHGTHSLHRHTVRRSLSVYFACLLSVLREALSRGGSRRGVHGRGGVTVAVPRVYLHDKTEK